MEALIRRAGREDLPKLVAFLKKAGLGTDGVAESIEYFLMMEDERGGIKASLGIQPSGNTGLLRSLVLTPGIAERDLFTLVEQIFVLAKDKKLTSLYMATNKEGSIRLFNLLGFLPIPAKDLPVEISELDHVKRIFSVDKSIFLAFKL